MSDVERRVRPDKATLADAVAERFLAVVTEAVEKRGVAHVVLTGGSMGTAFLGALGRSPNEVPWASLHLWWGDERFLPEGDGERNVTQARDALLDNLTVAPAGVHVMAASDGAAAGDVAAGASAYAAELDEAFGDALPQGEVPAFDVVMLGMGPDTHVASLFPGHEQTRADAVSVAAVTHSPKPPPERITMTFPTLNSAREVWLMVAGEDKRDAVRAASGSDDRVAHPACGVHGQVATVWWLDEAAAG